MDNGSDRMQTNSILTRGLDLCTQISYMSMQAERLSQPQHSLIVSFDVYCDLLEYSLYLQTYSGETTPTLEDYLRADELLFETNGRKLEIHIDFFLPANSIIIGNHG